MSLHGWKRARASSGLSSYKGSNLIARDLPLWSYPNQIIHTKASFPNTITLKIKASVYEFREDTIQSIAILILWLSAWRVMETPVLVICGHTQLWSSHMPFISPFHFIPIRLAFASVFGKVLPNRWTQYASSAVLRGLPFKIAHGYVLLVQCKESVFQERLEWLDFGHQG